MEANLSVSSYEAEHISRSRCLCSAYANTQGDSSCDQYLGTRWNRSDYQDKGDFETPNRCIKLSRVTEPRICHC